MVFNKERLPTDLRNAVEKDLQAIIAKDPEDDGHRWTRAPLLNRKNHSASRELAVEREGVVANAHDPNLFANAAFEGNVAHNDPVGNNSRETQLADQSDLHGSFFTPRIFTDYGDEVQKRLVDNGEKGFVFFPPDPPMDEIAQRVLSTLPFLPLRVDDPTTYSEAASEIIAHAFEVNGVCALGSTVSETRKETDVVGPLGCEGVYESFYNKTAPFDFKEHQGLASQEDCELESISSFPALMRDERNLQNLDFVSSPSSSGFDSDNGKLGALQQLIAGLPSSEREIGEQLERTSGTNRSELSLFKKDFGLGTFHGHFEPQMPSDNEIHGDEVCNVPFQLTSARLSESGCSYSSRSADASFAINDFHAFDVSKAPNESVSHSDAHDVGLEMSAVASDLFIEDNNFNGEVRRTSSDFVNGNRMFPSFEFSFHQP